MDADQTQQAPASEPQTDSQAAAAPADSQDKTPKAIAEDNYWKRQAEKAQKEADALRKAQMSEAERIKAERDEYKAAAEAASKRAQDLMIQSRFESSATRAGCVDPEAAYALVDRSLLAVDETGKVVGLEKALKALRESKPYLFGQQQARVGSGGGNPGSPAAPPVGQQVNDWIRKASGR